MIAARKPEDSDVYAELRRLNPDAYVAKGFAEAYLGHSEGDNPIAVYDYDACVEITMGRYGLDRSLAELHLRETAIPDIHGEGLPVFVVMHQ